MKIGLVGNGGREHAIAKVLGNTSKKDQLFVFASHPNPGIERIAHKSTYGSLLNIVEIVDFFAANRIDLVVIGPEAPLMAGIVDALRKKEIPVIGPTQSQTRLESDKAFMRQFLVQHNIKGSPEWRLVKNRREAKEFILDMDQVVVKPIGLTGGKGVQVMGTHLNSVDDALNYSDQWIEKNGSVLLEERLVGEEFSRIILSDGNTLVPMPVAQDFKYAFDRDNGPMTGGMGAYTMADGSMPFLFPEELMSADRLINEVIKNFSEQTGNPYRGILYGQFMVTKKGIRVIEFNVRFGDPEAINLMTLLQSDASQLFNNLANGKLTPDMVRFLPQASVCKYLVPQAYPENSPNVNFKLDEKRIDDSGLSLITSSVKKNGSDWQTLGSRTIALVGTGDHPSSISEKIEKLLQEIEPPQLRHRGDIGNNAVIQNKINRMNAIRDGI